MTDEFVAPEVVRERMARLTEVVEGSARVKHARASGRVEEVLVDGPSKTDPAMWSGRTRHNKLLHFAPTQVDCLRPRDRVAPAISCRCASRAPRRTGCAASSTGIVRPGRRRKVRIPVVAV